MDQARTDAELKLDEGTGPRLPNGNFVVYDDATGKAIVPGTLVKGHPTIAYGLALDVHGLTPSQALSLLHDGETEFLTQLYAALPWTRTLDDVRLAAILSMAYNLGIQGLLGFPNTLACMQRGDWVATVANLKQSKWWNQVGQRAQRIANMFLTGQWQV